MLGGADTKKLFSLKMLDGACIKKAPLSKGSSSNSNTRELFPRQMLGDAGIEKACLTQYVRLGWHEKLNSLKMPDGAGLEKASSAQ